MYNNLQWSPEPVVIPIKKPDVPEKTKEIPNMPNPFVIPKPIIKPGKEPAPKA